MSEQPTPLSDVASSTTKARQNPHELGLGFAGAIALVGGIILSGVGADIYAKDSLGAGYANALSGNGFASPDAWGMQLATFGNQLSTVGVIILIGLAFYAMVRWNQTHQA